MRRKDGQGIHCVHTGGPDRLEVAVPSELEQRAGKLVRKSIRARQRWSFQHNEGTGVHHGQRRRQRVRVCAEVNRVLQRAHQRRRRGLPRRLQTVLAALHADALRRVRRGVAHSSALDVHLQPGRARPSVLPAPAPAREVRRGVRGVRGGRLRWGAAVAVAVVLVRGGVRATREAGGGRREDAGVVLPVEAVLAAEVVLGRVGERDAELDGLDFAPAELGGR